MEREDTSYIGMTSCKSFPGYKTTVVLSFFFNPSLSSLQSFLPSDGVCSEELCASLSLSVKTKCQCPQSWNREPGFGRLCEGGDCWSTI